MLALLGLDKCYSTYESIKGDLQHFCYDFTLCEKGCIYGVKAVGTAVRCDREVRLQHLSFSCSFFDLADAGYFCRLSVRDHSLTALHKALTIGFPPYTGLSLHGSAKAHTGADRGSRLG